jgi:hypothetical protein
MTSPNFPDEAEARIRAVLRNIREAGISFDDREIQDAIYAADFGTDLSDMENNKDGSFEDDQGTHVVPLPWQPQEPAVTEIVIPNDVTSYNLHEARNVHVTLPAGEPIRVNDSGIVVFNGEQMLNVRPGTVTVIIRQNDWATAAGPSQYSQTAGRSNSPQQTKSRAKGKLKKKMAAINEESKAEAGKAQDKAEEAGGVAISKPKRQRARNKD